MLIILFAALIVRMGAQFADNSTYVLLDTTGPPGGRISGGTLSGTATATTNLVSVAWVFAPDAAYSFRIVNVTFGASSASGTTRTVIADFYNADATGAVTTSISTWAIANVAAAPGAYYTIAMWPYVYVPAGGSGNYAFALRSSGTSGVLFYSPIPANSGVNFGLLSLKRVYWRTAVATFLTLMMSMYVQGAGLVSATPSPSPTPSPTGFSQGASQSETTTPSTSSTASRTPSTSPTGTRSGTLYPSGTFSETAAGRAAAPVGVLGGDWLLRCASSWAGGAAALGALAAGGRGGPARVRRGVVFWWALALARGVAAQTPTPWPTGTPVSANVFTQAVDSIFYTSGTGAAITSGSSGLTNAGALPMPYTMGSSANNAKCVTQSCAMAAFGFSAFRQHGTFTITSVSLPLSRTSGGGPSWVVQVWDADDLGRPTTLRMSSALFVSTSSSSANCLAGAWQELTGLSLTIPGGGYYAVVVYLVAGGSTGSTAAYCALAAGANNNGALGGTMYMAAYSSANYGASWTPLTPTYGIVIRGSWAGAEGSGTATATSTASRSSTGCSSGTRSGATTGSGTRSGATTGSSTGSASGTRLGATTGTGSSTGSASGSLSSTATGTSAGTLSARTASATASSSGSASSTSSASSTGSASSTAAGTLSAQTASATASLTSYISLSALSTATGSATSTASAAESPTSTATTSGTGAASATESVTSLSTQSGSGSAAASATGTTSGTGAGSATASASSFSTQSGSGSAAATATSTASATGSTSASATTSATSSSTLSGSATRTPYTLTSTPTATASGSALSSPTASSTTSATSCGTASLSGAASSSVTAPPSASTCASDSASRSPATNSAPPSSSSTASLTASVPPSASPPQSASAIAGSPSAGDSPTAATSGTPSPCASLSGTPTLTASHSDAISATTQPGSESALPSPSAARSASPPPSATAPLTPSHATSPSPPGTTSVSASPSLPSSACATTSLSAMLSPQGSPTAGAATRTASPSGSSTASPSASSRPTGSAPATATATLTATPSKTLPRLSCLFRPGGCAQPALAPGWPLSQRGRALALDAGAPAAAFAAWPFFSATAVVTLPLPPALSEVATLLCEAAPAGLAVALGAGAPALAPCGGGGALPAALCVVVPSQAAGVGASARGVAIPLTVTLPGGGALPAAGAAAARISCELRSAFSGGAALDAQLLPRYGASTQLSLSLNVLPASQPLLAAVVLESRALAGTFRVIAGVGAGTVLPRLAPPGGNSSSGSGASWGSPFLGGPTGAPFLEPLLALLSPLQAAPAVAAAAPAHLSAKLSSSAHLLLLLAAGEPLLSAALPTVSLNGAPCAVNWVSGGGTVISVTTPPLATLCGGAGVPASGDCGTGVLVLREGGGDPLESLLAALRSASARPARRAQVGAAATLFLPSAYPPQPLPAAPAPLLAGLPLPELLAYARASAPAGTGFRLAEACTDPAYAPAEECSLVDGRAPPPPAAGTVCAYGAGAACSPCPADRAICPGGNVLLLKPGWWAPLATSPPGDAVPCPPPATERCPGWGADGGAFAAGAAARAPLCSRGYAGAFCGGCAKGFFPTQGACRECPSPSNKLEYAAPPAQFLGGLALLALLLHALARRALAAQQGGGAPPLCGAHGSGAAVGALLLWAWGAAQTLSALFSQTVADGGTPQPLAAAFAAFSALQFQGVAVAPACGEGGDPFSALWAATGAAYGAVAAGAVCVALLARASGGGPEESPPALRAARALLAVCVAFFRIGYGALVGTAVAALACNAPAPLSVADYAATRGDGALLAAAFGASLGRALPNMTLLRAAAGDPVFAETAGLAALLASPLPVPLLAADAAVVCGEAAQLRARDAALALLALLAGALPCGSLFALFAAGKLKGLRRMYASEDKSKGGGAAAPVPPLLPPPQPTAAQSAAAAILAAALHRPELLPRSQWLIAHDWALTALCTGATAYAATAASLRAYLAYQLTMAVALLGSAVLLWQLAPNAARHAWKNGVLVALYTLAGAAACANVALRYALPAGGAGALALCATLLAATAGVLALLLALWWRALSAGGGEEAQSIAEARGAAAARGAVVVGRGGGAGLALREAEVTLPPPSPLLPPPSAAPPDAEAAIPPPPPPTTVVVDPPVVHTRNPLREGDAQALLKLTMEAGSGARAQAPELAPAPPPQPPQLALRHAAEAPLTPGRRGAAAEGAGGAAPLAPPLAQREPFWWKTAASGKKRGGQRWATHSAER